MQYATEPKCNYCDSCMSEYCGCKLGRIKEIEPTCDSTAVIPSITVESVEGITNLANCLVHVNDINTTFYVDDKHRVMITWAGPVDIPGYDMENNPNGYRDQIVTDIEKGIAVIYDKHGKGYTFGIYDSLDSDGAVTQAINDKLDEMASDGTLADIISEYIGEPVYGFDTVADMKASTTLQAGDRARTLGFHSVNDGGGALYKITSTGTANEMDVIAVGNLYANLVKTSSMTPEMFGAYGDGLHDDHDALAEGLSFSGALDFNQDSTYKLGSTLTLNYNNIINGNNALLIGDNVNDYPILTIDGSSAPASRTKIMINDLRIECGTGINNRVHEGIKCNSAADFIVRNVFVRYATKGFHINQSLLFTFEYCHVQNTDIAIYGYTPDTLHTANNVKFDKCVFVANKYVINSNKFAFRNALFLNCEIEFNTSDGDAVIVVPEADTGGIGGDSLIFDSCWFESNTPRDIKAESSYLTPIVVKNCFITHTANTANAFVSSSNTNFGMIMESCQDLTSYIGGGTGIDCSSDRVIIMNCTPRLQPSQLGSATVLYDNFGVKNKQSIMQIDVIQNGSVNKGRIMGYSGYLNLYADTLSGVRFADATYQHPVVFGAGNVYMWYNGNNLYAKVGSAPANGTDGTLLVGS